MWQRQMEHVETENRMPQEIEGSRAVHRYDQILDINLESESFLEAAQFFLNAILLTFSKY